MDDKILAVLKYIFENHIKSERNFAPSEAELVTDLETHGFSPEVIEEAFAWLDALFKLHEAEASQTMENPLSSRVFSQEECSLLSTETRGSLMFLEQAGILNAITRERVINRLLAADKELIDRDYVKLITMLVLLSEQDEPALSSLEQLLFSEHGTGLH